MTEVVVTTEAVRRAKLQPNCHHQQTNIQFFLQAGCSSCRPTNSVTALKRNIFNYVSEKKHVQQTLIFLYGMIQPTNQPLLE